MARKRPPTTCEEIIQRRDELFEALSKESDRGVVLISASFLEEALEALLRARFSIRHPKSNSSINPLFGTFGPLHSFSAKVKICYATDLIGEWMYRDLEIVRNLRNDFAHSVGAARFDLPEAVKLTERLKAARQRKYYRAHSVGKINGKSGIPVQLKGHGTFFDELCLIMTGFDRGQRVP